MGTTRGESEKDGFSLPVPPKKGFKVWKLDFFLAEGERGWIKSTYVCIRIHKIVGFRAEAKHVLLGRCTIYFCQA